MAYQEISLTQRGGVGYFVQDYIYIRNKDAPKKLFLRCQSKGCYAKCTIDKETDLAYISDHVHEHPPPNYRRMKFISDFKEAANAPENEGIPLFTIFEQLKEKTLSSIQDPVELAALTASLPEYKNLKRQLLAKRSLNSDGEETPKKKASMTLAGPSTMQIPSDNHVWVEALINCNLNNSAIPPQNVNAAPPQVVNKTCNGLPRDINKKREDFICWDDYFMSVAFLSAQRSKDPSSQVGACIVNDERKIVGIGYNGMPNGCSDDALPWNKESEDPLETKYPYVCHAEMNAILNKNSADVKNCTMYVALFPCNNCAKLVIQSGIKKILYFSDKHRNKMETKASKRMLTEAKIDFQQYIPKARKVVIDFSVIDDTVFDSQS